MRISELLDLFIEFEANCDMYEVEFCGVKMWEALRDTAFDVLRYHLVEEFSANIISPAPKKYTGKYTVDVLYDRFVRRNAFLKIEKRDVLIMSSVRKRKIDDQTYRDDYTYYLDKYLKRSHYVLNRDVDNRIYVRQESHNIIQFREMGFEKIYRIMNNMPASERHRYVNVDEFDKKLICPMEAFFHIELTLGEKRKLLSIANYRIEKMPIFLAYYNLMFDIIRPKIVLFSMRGATTVHSLIEVSKSRNIPTVELQHGMSSRSYIQTNFPDSVKPEFFADYYFCFGEIEKKNSRWPIDQSHIYPVGLPVLDMERQKYNNKNKNGDTKTILFLSNLRIAVAYFVRDFCKLTENKDIHVIFKLHPGECAAWLENIYPILRDCNLEIVHDFDKPIYYYLGKADWTVGRGSTALVDASAFDTEIAIIETDDLEDDVLFQNGIGVAVKSPEELLEKIEMQGKKTRTKAIYEEDSINKIENAISEIITNNKGA